ncbi:MAG TPA: ROK family glucokinase [Nocardioides sp.]|uniref:ROK family glucokinase n=1 Tax=Nocardioides sp. TaxID=35761 RepID=UPI002BA4EC24|nr:ROK family glucokinase [Nocardioides sp.]HQR27164.1 ROK family glucokinase [Nocardioides sp.]
MTGGRDDLAVGVDVGGTKIAAGVVDRAGEVLEVLRVDSPAADAGAIRDAIADLVTQLRARHRVTAVGVGAAGFVDKTRSVVLFAPNLAWRDMPLRADLVDRLGLPVVIENDGNAAAWGEFAFGAGADTDDLLLLTVGTGVGGGIVLDGRLHRGAFGVAAEVGHLRVVPDGRLCGCGNHGCLEQYASGSALVRSAREEAAAGNPLARDLLDRAGGDPARITGPVITEAAQRGDAFAVAQLATVGRWLGEGLASLAVVLDPAVAVIGGGVSAAGDLLLDPVREGFAGQWRGTRPALEVRRAELGNRAGVIGAADLARR